MAVIILKNLNHRENDFTTSKTCYLSTHSPTGWNEEIHSSIKFDDDTGIAVLSALKTLLTEAGEGKRHNITIVVIEGDPEPAEAAAVLGKIGGKSTSEAKRVASRSNGLKGGRPKGSKNKEAKIAP